MISTAAFAAFALGLRHGADPDHLAAIDNMTRNSAHRRPLLSRFIGTLFAAGHTVMLLSIAAIVGSIGGRFARHAGAIEDAGTVIAIVVLVAIALVNVRQLVSGEPDCIAGAKTRLLPRILRNAATPWVAVPVGFLFGLGFETSSQIAAYAVAFGAEGGVAGALTIGSTFCAGMVCTDTLDSIFVHKLVTHDAGRMPEVMRVWIWSVTIFALAIAAYEFAKLTGWRSPIPDLAVSAVLVISLLTIFAFVMVTLRRRVADPA